MTISHTAPPLGDTRVQAARQALAELPPAEDIERPYFWIGRLRTAMHQLLDVAAPAPGGLDTGQREVAAAALADAIDYRGLRVNPGLCADCDADPSGLCSDHAADCDLADAYLHLAAELGLELDR